MAIVLDNVEQPKYGPMMVLQQPVVMAQPALLP